MNRVSFLVALILVSFFATAQTGYKQDLAGLVSITFPSQPQKLDTLGYKFYKSEDMLSFYVASSNIIDPQKTIIDADSIPEFYDGVAKGMLGASGGKMLNKRTFQLEGLTGLEFSHTLVLDTNMPGIKYVRMLVINSTLVIIQFSTSLTDQRSADPAKEQFFNSLKITADRSRLTQGVDNSAAYRFGVILGVVTVCVVILGVLAGIGFLLRRLFKGRG